MTFPNIEPTDVDPEGASTPLSAPACVLAIGANDPSGAAGLAADVLTIASVGAHPLPVVTGAWIRDTAGIRDFFGLPEEAVAEQARAALEDVSVRVIKIGFAGRPETLAVLAELTTEYGEIPVVACLPDLTWWSDDAIDAYLDALRELLLPEVTVLVGNVGNLTRWLLPDWSGERGPTPRELAIAAAEFGTPYVVVTGIHQGHETIENVLVNAQSVLASERFERIEAVFSGASDTLASALAALLATGCDLTEAFRDALQYLDGALDAGFRPGMGGAVPDRLFWAQPDEAENAEEAPEGSIDLLNQPFNDTRH